MIVWALLQRLTIKDALIGMYVESEIKLLHVMEAILVDSKSALTPEDLESDAFQLGLRRIVWGPNRRQAHEPQIIFLQRDLLNDFLLERPLPDPINKQNLRRWLNKNAETIVRLLSVFPCNCVYRESLATMDDDLIEGIRTSGQLTDETLVALHGSSRSVIRKILSHPSKANLSDFDSYRIVPR